MLNIPLKDCYFPYSACLSEVTVSQRGNIFEKEKKATPEFV